MAFPPAGKKVTIDSALGVERVKEIDMDPVVCITNMRRRPFESDISQIIGAQSSYVVVRQYFFERFDTTLKI
jgi:hypothetical protein